MDCVIAVVDRFDFEAPVFLHVAMTAHLPIFVDGRQRQSDAVEHYGTCAVDPDPALYCRPGVERDGQGVDVLAHHLNLSC